MRGISLALARLAWVAVAGLALLLFVLGIPARYDHIRNLSGADALGAGWTPATIRSALAQLGLSTDFRAIYSVTLAVLVATGALLVAVALVWRKADDRLALFVSLFLLTLGTWPTGVTAALVVSHPEWSLPNQLVTDFVLIGFVFFCLLFPDGRFTPRWSQGLALIWSLLVLTVLLVGPGVGFVGQLLLGGGWISAVCAQIYRYRRVSDAVQRQQTKWVVFGAAGLVVTFFVFVFLLPVLVPALYQASALGLSFEMTLTPILFGAFLFLPVSVGIALLRYRLWDIDLVLSRTVVYGALTVGVLALSALVVGALGAFFQTSGNALVALLATGLVAALLFPVRTRLQREVNRLIYGQRDEPLTVLAHLGQQLEATLAPDTVFPHLVDTIAQALKLPHTAILLRDAGEFSVVASSGQPARYLVTLPIRYQEELIGQLQVAPRTPREAFTPADLRLLEELARQAGVAAHAVELSTELQRAREQLVIAREEERRRLRRDLHDGLGPTLAALALKATTISDLIPTDSDAATHLSNELYDDILATVGEIRRLVYALRPPTLDDLGLVAALRECATHYARHDPQGATTGHATGVRIQVEAPDRLPPLPAAVELAAYRIVQEALTNVARHAQAQTCTVRVVMAESLQIEVGDDGIGFPADYQAGVGVHSMRERAAELGGACEIESRPGVGVRIHARLPVPKEQPDGAFTRADRG
jgi:signal transduction histidine kinase